LLGVDLQDAREEIFVRMVCDGLALGVAYVRAGFKGKSAAAASALFALPRIQERANAILEARRTTGVVTLSEVTDMLQRVYAGAHAAEEYSAAHNAAFSLARLYGHVTDKATLEVIRRPSRDPDAPSEQVLSDWVASLPVVGQSPEPSEALLEGLPHRAPAEPLGSETTTPPSTMQPEVVHDVEPPQRDATGMEIENGAPTNRVTGAPPPCGPADLLGPGSSKDGSPLADEGTVYPSADELFG